MTRRTTRLAQELEKRGLSMSEFAPTIVGRANKPISVGTLRNVACGSSKSRLVRQRVQERLQVQLWNDVPLVREAWFELSAGDFVVLPSVEMASELAREVGDAVEQRGRHVRFCKPVQWRFSAPDPSESDEAKIAAPAVDDGTEQAIEIWSDDVPPDSPWSQPDRLQKIPAAAGGRVQPRRETKKIASKPAVATGEHKS